MSGHFRRFAALGVVCLGLSTPTPIASAPAEAAGTTQVTGCAELRSVGQAGGWVKSIALSGSTVFAGVGARLVRLEPVADGDLEVVALSAPLRGIVNAIAVDGERQVVFAAVGRSGPGGTAIDGSLVVFDTRDSGLAMVSETELDVWPEAAALAISADGERKLAVSGWNCDCLLLADVVNNVPLVVGATRIPMWVPRDAALDSHGDYIVAIGEDADQRAQFVLWSQAAGLVTIELGGFGDPFSGLAADGDNVYLLGSNAVVDVTDRRSPSVVEWPFSFQETSDIAGGIMFTSSDDSLFALDIRDPNNRVILGGVGTGLAWGLDKVVVLGSSVAVVGEGISLFDAVDPTAMQLRGAWESWGTTGALAVRAGAVFTTGWTQRLWRLSAHDFGGRGLGTTVSYLRDDVGGDGYNGLDVNDQIAVVIDRNMSPGTVIVADLKADGGPVPVGSWSPLPLLNDVALDGAHAYVVHELGLHVMDVSDPREPRPVAFVEGDRKWGRTVSFNGDTLAVAWSGGLSLIDVSEPERPAELSEGPGSYVDTAFSDRWLFASSDAPEALGLEVIDVVDPVHPRRVSRFPLSQPGPVGVSGAWVFVADGPVLHMLRATDDGQVTLVDTAELPEDVVDIAVDGLDVYVSVGGAGIFAFDLRCHQVHLPAVRTR